MENLLMKFQCPVCKTQGQIELIHDAAWTKSQVYIDEYYDLVMFEDTEVCSYGDAWYRCANCDQRIDIGASTEDLIEFLESL